MVRMQRGLTRQELAERMGFGNARTVAAIEKFEYRLDFLKLKKVAKALRKPNWYFCNAFLLVCEEKFRYLVTGKVDKQQLGKFEETMREYVGIYRFLLNYFNIKDKLQAPKFDLRLQFDVSDPEEFAVNAGEKIASILQLGMKPIDKLQSALEEKLGIMTVMLDADRQAIAGASLSLPEAGFICVNRHLPQNKRSFTIAHELFHLLTWDALPYDRTSRAKIKYRKAEELADVFASSLLMPRQKVVQIEGIGKKQQVSAWVVENATDLGVSAQALSLRIKQIGEQRGKDYSSVLAQLNLPKLDVKVRDRMPAKPFAKKYVELIARGIEEPLMSTISGVHKLGCKTFYEAADIFATHKAKPPQTLRFAMPDFRKRWKKIR